MQKVLKHEMRQLLIQFAGLRSIGDLPTQLRFPARFAQLQHCIRYFPPPPTQWVELAGQRRWSRVDSEAWGLGATGGQRGSGSTQLGRVTSEQADEAAAAAARRARGGPSAGAAAGRRRRGAHGPARERRAAAARVTGHRRSAEPDAHEPGGRAIQRLSGRRHGPDLLRPVGRGGGHRRRGGEV